MAAVKHKVDEDLKLLEVGFGMLRLARMDPNFPNKKGLVFAVFGCVLRFLNVGLIFVMVTQSGGNALYVVNCLKSMSAFLQGFAKLLPIFIFPKYLCFIRNAAIQDFWKTSENAEPPEGYSMWYKTMLWYKYGQTTVYSLMVVQTMILKRLLFPIFVPNFPHAFTVLALMQYIQFTMDLIYVVAMDLIFLASCVIVWRQFKFLVKEFSSIDGSKGPAITTKEVSRCVRHHNFLLEYVHCVIETYKYPLLFQYAISIMGLCIELYIISEKPPLFDLFASVLYVTFMSAQLGIYCFIADQTSEMIRQLSLLLSKTNWYDNPIYLNKMIQIVICRSQKEVKFTAGGMTKIDIEAFTTIFKTAFSVFTLMKKMND